MGKTKRDLIRRNLAQSLHSLDNSGETIGKVHTTFSDGKHASFVTMLELIIQQHIILIQFIKEFWIHAYGHIPENYDSYRR